MPASISIAPTELILGGQKSGKSARAESLAVHWLHASEQHQALFIATAQAWDAEMQARIARHQADRALRLPQMRTVEEPRAIAALIREHSRADTLIVLDCITLWLTNCMMPADDAAVSVEELNVMMMDLLTALQSAPGPVVLVSNEIGLGVIPLGAEVRAYVDQLGKFNQALAAQVARVSWMIAGLPVIVKDQV